ncbi:MAG: hypothetical protein M1840_004032 [Geoglossum simile]|nr:MAG: hypothetical protein M1840_004032 [Geoglossum simile]
MSDKKTSIRSTKLRALLSKVLSGREDVTANNAKQFLEAICDQPEPSICIQRLASSAHGYPALHSALCSSISTSFLNSSIAPFLHYLEAPELRTICGGEVLRQIILKVVNTQLLWGAIVRAAGSSQLSETGFEAFSWLLLQLVSLPTAKAITYAPIVRDERIQKQLLESSQLQVRLRAQRIVHIISTIKARHKRAVGGPGGRHDNDFSDIRKIAILPTPDELASKDPFLPRACEVYKGVPRSDVLALHVDSQFRLLREDMLRDLREEVQISLMMKKGRRRGFCVEHLSMAGVQCDRRQPWSLQLRCTQDLPQLPRRSTAERKQFLQDNPRFLKHESVACLTVDDEVAALGTLIREEDLLAQNPPVLCLQIPERTMEKSLLRIKTAKNVKLVQLSTAFFAYEPVLKQLKEIKELSLEEDILFWKPGRSLPRPNYQLSNNMINLMDTLEKDPSHDLSHILQLSYPTKLDKSQTACLLAGLRQKLSLIQGPPGTGKSFVGSLIARAIHRHSSEKILIVCYTHHALDQFLEDLLIQRVPAFDIVRLGSAKKATAKTEALSIKQTRATTRLTREQGLMFDLRRQDVTEAGKNLCNAFASFQQTSFSKPEILEHLEFKSDGPRFFDAFEMPEEDGNMTRVGKKGRAMERSYLLDRWYRGKDAGVFQRRAANFQDVWGMKSHNRSKALNEWRAEMLSERLAGACESGTAYNASLDQINAIYMEKDLAIIRHKRIIACTTTAAAKYVQALQSIAPGVLLVEEAGEILESHILTALGPDTKQLILIGDHKQLRPRVHHDLSVEKGSGYDLNRSLFERLVLRGYPHDVLSQQHRMRPELSALVRQLTYPDLADAPSTQGRPNLRGLRDNLIFVNHEENEVEMPDVPDWKDTTSTSSKENVFEAKMVLNCVRYLGQQGYKTDNIVVLTPYLGQLRLLAEELGKANDPVLNDLDSHDLIRAGLIPAVSVMGRPRIRISTIDNFQGDESDIAVVSLTRSNPRREIGFMVSPERLNVLLSRARNALILIGDAETFTGSRSGGELWQQFIGLLKAGNHVYDGFPIRCERHIDRVALLRCPEDFGKECPDGGCTEPCDVMLNCGLHRCPQYCHQVHDHSKMLCERVIEFKCAKNHLRRRECHKSQPSTCAVCELDDRRQQKELEAELEMQNRRDKTQLQFASEAADLDLQIRRAWEQASNCQTALDRARTLEQKRWDLDARILAQAAQPTGTNSKESISTPNGIALAPPATASTVEIPRPAQPENASWSDRKAESDAKSPSETEWERQKRVEGASNDAIDTLMGLTGLEDVKAKVLNIKAKMDTVARQGTDMRKERLGMVMLGNPGTGKTTVARLYAQFLVSIGALPGKEFVEATASSLANEGVPGAKKKISDILVAGGGVFFLDEAYQLSSGNSFGGAAVLDFLLAEIEEMVGKIVFILAGYSKEMEKFLESNPGFNSRIPHRLNFPDYMDKELLIMLGHLVESRYSGRAKIEDGLNGLYARILIQRLGRGRGAEGYGNARALENLWARITERQANRLHQERITGTSPDDFLFTKEDLIGPEPLGAFQQSMAWKELQSLIGLHAVKQSVMALVNRMRLNYQRELNEKPPVEVSLNRIFLGSPGTGKTTVGKLYALILADLGLLSKSEVVLKNPADFIGSALGETEKNTKEILKATEGKVLIIDEAYMLYPGCKGGGHADPYKAAVIDTIVSDIQSIPGEDRCVLLLGYKDQMEEMLENSNPGLARRFPMNHAFHFEDFNDEELRAILDLKLKKQGLEATEEAKAVAIELLSRARDRPNFGNAGEVENLISHAKESEQKRSLSNDSTSRGPDIIFLPQDFDEHFDRARNSAVSCRRIFADIVGCENLIKKLEGYQRIAVIMRARKRDPRDQIPLNFIFKGPPGTGKTTVARKMAELFYEMGVLSTKDYLECSASDLIGQYVGQTAPKTRDVLRKALGKVLFVDEAYRLCDGEFGKEGLSELVDSLTKPQFIRKIVVILAGYGDDMNNLLRTNPGLSSRFPEQVIFENMKPQECLTLLGRQLKQNGIEIAEDTASPQYIEVIDRLQKLSSLPWWGNGRDIQTLSKSITAAAFESADSTTSTLTVAMVDISRALESMSEDQKTRCIDGIPTDNGIGSTASKAPLVTSSQPAPLNTSISTTPSVETAEPKLVVEEHSADEELQSDKAGSSIQPDLGVSDETWKQLQADIEAHTATRQHLLEIIANQERHIQDIQASEEESNEKLRKLEDNTMQSGYSPDEEEITHFTRKQEEERQRSLAIKAARQEAEEGLRRVREDAELRQREEAKVLEKLREMGVCPMGYYWIKQAGGYRCSAGGHFVSNTQLGI